MTGSEKSGFWKQQVGSRQIYEWHTWQLIPAALLLGLQQGLMSAVKCLKNAFFLKNKKNYKNLKKVVDKSKNLQYNQYCSEGHKEIQKQNKDMCV